MSDYKITVGTELTGAEKLDAFEKKLNDLKTEKINVDVKLTVDSKNIASDVTKQLNRQLGGKLEIDAQVDIDPTIDKRAMSKAVSQVQNMVNASMKGAAKFKPVLDETYLNKLATDINQRLSKIGSMSSSKKYSSNQINGQLGFLKDDLKSWNSIMKEIDPSELPLKMRHSLALTQKAIDEFFVNVENKQLDLNIDEQIREEAARAKAELKSLERFMGKFNSDKIYADFDSMFDRFDKIDKPSFRLKTLKGELDELRLSLGGAVKDFELTGKTDGLLEWFDNFETTTQSFNHNLRSAEITQKRSINNIKKLNDSAKLQDKKDLLNLQIDKWLIDNSAAAGQFGDRLKSIQDRIADCDAAGLGNLQSEFQKVKLEAGIADKNVKTFGDRIKDQIREYSTYAVVASGIAVAAQSLSTMARNVLEVDTAMVGLYRVTDLTSRQYDELYSKMISSSKEYGRTLTDTINATSDWVRAGFDADTSVGLAGITAMYQNVSDLDYNEATKNLLTAYNGFKNTFNEQFAGDSLKSVEHIADVFNKLDNEFSVTAAGLGEGLARSASALEIAGNTFEESAAMVGAITEVTQDPEKAGNALKTISMRIRGMKGELEELGEDSEGVENISKMQGQILKLTHGKVNIFDSSGDFKSTYDILTEVASIYDKLSTVEQADLLETMAGKNRANDLAAFFSNYEVAIDMVDAAENSFGSAAEENQKFVDSLQGRLNALQAAIQNISNSAMDSGFLKGVISGATSFIDVLSEIIDKFGMLPTALGVGAGVFSAFGKNVFTLNNGLKIFGKSLSDIFGILGSFARGNFGDGMNKIFDGKSTPFDSLVKQLEIDWKKYENFRKRMSKGDITQGQAAAETLGGTSDELRQMAVEVDLKEQHLRNLQKIQKQELVAETAKSRSIRKQVSLFNEIKSAMDSTDGKSEKLQLTFSEMSAALDGSGTHMEKYLKGLNGADMKMGAYAMSLVKATAKTIAQTAAQIALNAAMTMGAAVAIQAVITGIMSLVQYYDNLAESVAEINNKYKEQRDEIKKNKATIDELAPQYEKLSKGVNTSNNKNVSLSNDEYEEYLNIVNQIGETFPELIRGYDAQGNAILTAAGSVEKLNGAYKNAMNNNYDEVLKSANQFMKDFKHDKKNVENPGIFDGFFGYFDDNLQKEGYDKLKKIMNGEGGLGLRERIDKEIPLISVYGDEIVNAFKRAGVDKKFGELHNDFLERVIEEQPEVAQQVLSSYEENMAAMAEEMQSIAEAYIGKGLLNGDYSGISEDMQGIIEQIVPNMGYDYFSQFDSVNAMYDSLDNMLSQFDNLDIDNKKTFETFFDMEAQVNSGDISVNDYIANLDKMRSVIDGMDIDDETKKALKISLQLDDNDIENEFKNLEERLVDAGMARLTAKNLMKDMDTFELEAAVDLVASGEIDFDNISSKKLADIIEHNAKVVEAMHFSPDISVDTENLEKFNAAMAESKTATGLTSESIDVLKGRYADLAEYNPASLFEETANGIRINTTEMGKLERKLAETSKTELDDKLKTLKGEYDGLQKEILECTDASEMANKIADSDTLANKIHELAEYGAQLDGLTSKLKAWQDAEAAGNDRDPYESVLSGYETVENEINRGWWDDSTVAYLELLTGRDLSTAKIDDLRSAYESLDKTIGNTKYTIKDFFTTNKDGESDTNGIYNFLEVAESFEKQLGYDFVQRDANNNIIGFDISVEGRKALADAMGISEELVDIIVRASEDAGFVVNMDGTYTALAELQSKAEEAATTLKSIDIGNGQKKDYTGGYEFNFKTTTIDGEGGLKEQLGKATDILDQFKQENGTLILDADADGYIQGTNEALTMALTLQQTLDNLEHSHYVNIDTSKAEEELKKPLEQVEKYEKLYKDKNLFKLSGKIVDVEDAEKQMKEIAASLEKEDVSVKASLGIDGMSADEIEKAIIDGTVKIPTELDIVSSIDDSLKLMLDKELVEKGLMSKDAYEMELEVYAKSRNVDTTELEKDIDESVDKAVPDKIMPEIGSDFGGSLDEIKSKAKDAADAVYDLVQNGKMKSTFEWDFDTTDMSLLDRQISKATEMIGEFKRNSDGTIDISATGAEETQNILAALLLQKESLDKPAIMQVGVTDPSSEVGQAMTMIQSLYASVVDRNIQIAIGADASGAEAKVAEIAGQIASLKEQNPELYAKLGLDTTEFNSALATINENVNVGAQLDPNAVATIQSSLSGISGDVLAKISGLDTSLIDGYQAPEKKATVKFEPNHAPIDAYINSNINADGTVNFSPDMSKIPQSVTIPGTINWSNPTPPGTTGKSPANGTAHSRGTALAEGSNHKKFRSGDWGIRGSGTALVGELGQEIVVRDGRYFTIGDNGAEFFNYKSGDIIFNHKQAEELFKNGYVTSGGGRGRAFAEGTAFSTGTGGAGRPGGGYKPMGGGSSSSSNKSSSKSKSSSKANEEAKEFEETLDFIEILIDRVERAIKRLDTVASSSFRSWSERTSALNEQIAETSREISIQQQAYDRYISQANSIGLDAGWAQKVRDGAIDISTIKDEDLANKIKEYQDFYEKALDCKDAILELQEAESELYQQRFDNVSDKFEGYLGVIQHEKDMLDEFVSQSEAHGWITSKKYYEALAQNTNNRISELKKQRDEMTAEMNAAVDSGAIEKGSQAW